MRGVPCWQVQGDTWFSSVSGRVVGLVTDVGFSCSWIVGVNDNGRLRAGGGRQWVEGSSRLGGSDSVQLIFHIFVEGKEDHRMEGGLGGGACLLLPFVMHPSIAPNNLSQQGVP